jgi:rod shape-determining protein MreC
VNKKTNGRKGRNKQVAARLLLVLTLICCLILFALTFGGKFGFFHQLTLETLGPVQSFFTKVSTSIAKVKDDYIALWDVRDENKQLRGMVNEYHEKLSEYREAYSTHLRLTEKMRFKEKEPFPSITARVVGKDPSYWFQTIIVDRGEGDGVVEGMVARTERGVAGQVIQVSSNYSKILLANAPSSAIDAMVQKNRVRGILKGAGQKGFNLYYVLKKADVAVGDHIVTAGIGGVFPSGVPLGVVSAVRKKRRGMFLEIEVEPAVDFQRLETIFINLTEKLKFEAEIKSISGDRF